MEEVLRALNAIVSERVIESYAIGGAVGAAAYIEAAQTEDVDAFVFLPVGANGLINVGPVYAALVRHGGVIEGEHVRFGGWPLQVLPDATPLIAEAITNAMLHDFEGVPMRVFRPEYLCCIALATGRPKDYLRVIMFLDEEQVDRNSLREMAMRYNLMDRLAKAEALQSQ